MSKEIVYAVLTASENQVVDRAEGCFSQDLSQPLVNKTLDVAVRLLSEKGWNVKNSRQDEGRTVVILEKIAHTQTTLPIKVVVRNGRVVEQYFIPDSLIAQPVGMEERKLRIRLLAFGFTQERVEPQEGNVCIYFFSAPR